MGGGIYAEWCAYGGGGGGGREGPMRWEWWW